MVEQNKEKGSTSRPAVMEDWMSTIRDEWTQTQRNLGRLETLVEGLLESQKQINQALKELSGTLDRKTSTDIWKIIGAFVGVAGVALVYFQIRGNADSEKFNAIAVQFKDVSDDIQRIDQRAVDHISLEGHPTGMAIIRAESKRLDEQIRTQGTQARHLEERIRAVERDIVTRGEHAERWTRQASESDALRGTLMDEIRRLNDMIDKIRERAFDEPDGVRIEERIDVLEEGLARVQALLKDTREDQRKP